MPRLLQKDLNIMACYPLYFLSAAGTQVHGQLLHLTDAALAVGLKEKTVRRDRCKRIGIRADAERYVKAQIKQLIHLSHPATEAVNKPAFTWGQLFPYTYDGINFPYNMKNHRL